MNFGAKPSMVDYIIKTKNIVNRKDGAQNNDHPFWIFDSKYPSNGKDSAVKVQTHFEKSTDKND